MAIKITGPYFSSLVQDESRIVWIETVKVIVRCRPINDKEVGQGLERFV